MKIIPVDEDKILLAIRLHTVDKLNKKEACKQAGIGSPDTLRKYMKRMKVVSPTDIKHHASANYESLTNKVHVTASTPYRNKDSVVMAIPDLHCPWQHPDALDFLKAVADRFKPTDIVCLGDEIDAMGFSRYPKDPDAPSQGKELEMAIEQLIPFYKAFPNVKVCESNHTIRPWKKSFEAGLPASFLPTISRVLRAPDGWEWRNHWEVDGVRYIHGDAGSSGFTAHIQYMRKFKQPVVIGHIHSYGGVNYEGSLFGMNAGCLIDATAICFKYAKNMPIPVSLGCGIVKNGNQAYFIPMITDNNGRWVGRL